MTRNLAEFQFGDTSIEVFPESKLAAGQTCDISVQASGRSAIEIDSLSLGFQIHCEGGNGFETKDVCRFDLVKDGTVTDEPIQSWTKAIPIPRNLLGSLGTTVVTSRIEITTSRGQDSCERDAIVEPIDTAPSLFDQMVDFGFRPLKCTCVTGDGDADFGLQILCDSRQTDFEGLQETVSVVIAPGDDGCSVYLIDGTVDTPTSDVSSATVSGIIEVQNDGGSHDLASQLLNSL